MASLRMNEPAEIQTSALELDSDLFDLFCKCDHKLNEVLNSRNRDLRKFVAHANLLQSLMTHTKSTSTEKSAASSTNSWLVELDEVLNISELEKQAGENPFSVGLSIGISYSNYEEECWP